METKSPSPDKDGVGVADVEVSTRVPSDSSDVVVSGKVWADLNSISESELRVLWESAAVCFRGSWFLVPQIDYQSLGGLSHLYTYTTTTSKELLLNSPLNHQVYSQKHLPLIYIHFNIYTHAHMNNHFNISFYTIDTQIFLAHVILSQF